MRKPFTSGLGAGAGCRAVQLLQFLQCCGQDRSLEFIFLLVRVSYEVGVLPLLPSPGHLREERVLFFEFIEIAGVDFALDLWSVGRSNASDSVPVQTVEKGVVFYLLSAISAETILRLSN